MESWNSGRRVLLRSFPLFQCSIIPIYITHPKPQIYPAHTRHLSLHTVLPIMERPGASGKTTRSPLRAKDDENFALSASRDADRVLGPLDSIYVGSLQSGLDNFLGNQSGCCRWTVHFKLPAAHGGLHGLR